MWNLKAKKEQRPRPYRDAIARMIAEKIIMLQHRLVHLLQRWDRRLSVMQKKALLLVFCVASSSYCSYLFSRGVFARSSAAGIQLTKPPPDDHKKQHQTINK